MFKIAVDLTGRKSRHRLCRPHNAVKLFPGIAIVIAIEVNDNQLAILDHHVLVMIITMLKTLRPIRQQVAVALNIGNQMLSTVKLNGAGAIQFNFAIRFSAKSRLPVRKITRSRQTMYQLELPTGL